MAMDEHSDELRNYVRGLLKSVSELCSEIRAAKAEGNNASTEMTALRSRVAAAKLQSMLASHHDACMEGVDERMDRRIQMFRLTDIATLSQHLHLLEADTKRQLDQKLPVANGHATTSRVNTIGESITLTQKGLMQIMLIVDGGRDEKGAKHLGLSEKVGRLEEWRIALEETVRARRSWAAYSLDVSLRILPIGISVVAVLKALGKI